VTLLEPSLPTAPAALSWTDLGLEEGIASIVLPAHTLATGSSTGEHLDRLFKADRDLDCVVFVTRGLPTHLVTRERYYSVTGGPYGFTLYQKKPAENVAKASPLVVEKGAGIRLLTRRALDRPREDQYDPVIVTDTDGSVLGIVTIKQLIQRASELEVQVAQLANPLTRLPSGRVVQEWIGRGLAEDSDGGLTVAFTDLDRFKELNDVYGLLVGDEMVRRTARVLGEGLSLLGPGARLGHPGGDDFVLVSPRPISSDALREICLRFDREKLELFRPDDLQRGYFYATDDRGNRIRVPLTTLSVAVVGSRALGAERHPAVFSLQAARLRRTARTLTTALGRSGFVAADGWPEAPC
jgi:GGDEF domain-containing protein